MSLDDSDVVPLEEHEDYSLLNSAISNFGMYDGVDLNSDLKHLKIFLDKIEAGFDLEDSDREKIFEIQEKLSDLYSSVGRSIDDLSEISDRLGR